MSPTLATALFRAAAGCLALLAAAAAAAATPAPPRAAVEDVARTIAQQYFDPGRGAEMADTLRNAAKTGTFDAASQPEALAAALNPRLRAMDGHLRVRVTGNGTGDDAMPRRMRPRDAAPVQAGGIRAVEVLPGNVGYLSLGEFADFAFGGRDEAARTAIDAALARLVRTEAMVIDLRGNGGGSPAMVGYLVSAFTPRGADIYNTFRTREAAHSEAPGEWHASPRTAVPLYVLIDRRTGSAAESFAYTLASAKRATLVGERSGGAANPGRYFPTNAGLDVFVPTGSPLNPITRGNWEGSGVVPDVATSSAEALASALALARKGSKQRR